MTHRDATDTARHNHPTIITHNGEIYVLMSHILANGYIDARDPHKKHFNAFYI